jgi:hypothetical protein
MQSLQQEYIKPLQRLKSILNHKFKLTKKPMAIINHPIVMLPIIKNAIAVSLEETQNLHTLLLKAKDKPHILNDNLVERAIKQYQDGIEFIGLYNNQVKLWESRPMTNNQAKEVETLKTVITQLETLYQEALAHANKLSEHTIDKILKMSEVELALKVLSKEIKI